ncbi:TIGR01777 family protein [Halioglobus japonicus]|uniref:TIGR01777 family protein n=1 Tax=Halioglobus japonicus TaxID=930805 RepID=A0AAP8MG63_9GAMM|nr:TIGR01777 family oxidoreductase [Halioglobus japonicus]AQA18777.1 TIGR01777 family protein [Halioglobus japonicus]PLW86809.1 TIGR01777 family protein [Halioglobus japonicus]GHD10958.1 hypothetical protein GCM10007052_10150 [Halioglobus japonicus]
MRILVTGGTGFIGEALLPELVEDGHDIVVYSRQVNPCEGRFTSFTALADIPSSETFDAFINLAGASMAGKRWSRSYKQQLVNSRIDTTQALVDLASRLAQPPAVILTASAIGYYGHHQDEALGEDGQQVPGFAQDLCQRWEETAAQARELGCRVTMLRLGVVLDQGGGAFVQMAGSFRFGLGTWLGSGRQWLSWVHRADVVAAIKYLLQDDAAEGPFNLSAPEPVTAREFCRELAHHYSPLVSLPVPGPVARILVGEMADELLLNGQRVVPSALQANGFVFRYPSLRQAVTAIQQ